MFFKRESAKVGWTCKVGQVINLRENKFEQPISCVVPNSIYVRKINFHWVFLFTSSSPKRLKHLSDFTCPSDFC